MRYEGQGLGILNIMKSYIGKTLSRWRFDYWSQCDDLSWSDERECLQVITDKFNITPTDFKMMIGRFTRCQVYLLPSKEVDFW